MRINSNFNGMDKKGQLCGVAPEEKIHIFTQK